MSRAFLVSALSFIPASLVACGGDAGDGIVDGDANTDVDAPKADAPSAGEWSAVPSLPVAIANNAVGDVLSGTDCTLFSVLGIGGTFENTDISNAAFRWSTNDSAWQAIDDAPGPPRVAANAVGVAGNLYVIGGYTVADNGAEVSGQRLDMYNLSTETWEEKTPIPIAIDDTVALAWLDRYIVVVSGWSNTGNVDAVQIYDTENDLWDAGTAFPGAPAFGHAGAIDGNTIIIIDGAASTAGFPLVNQAWRGELDPDNPTVIAWTDLGAHPGPGRYRAAGGLLGSGIMWFHGGTPTPYNFDGLRYDTREPAEPLGTTLAFGDGGFFEVVGSKPSPTMDHRSLASCAEGEVFSVGGMIAGPEATTAVSRFDPAGDS